ncbi:MAG: LVIVD repeat-containing protein [Actinomycetota bacterium]
MKRSLRAVLSTAVTVALLVPLGTASAHHPDHRSSHAGEGDVAVAGHQHGGDLGHLDPSREDVQLVGELEPTDEFGPIVEGQIADLAVYKDHAYLNSWSEESCTKGGVYVVDIRNPKKPSEVGFIPALPGNYHGEGAHVISVSTKSFTGDLLAVNNEFCTDTPTVGGGFDLYDVTDPRNPTVLVQGAGDRGGEGRQNGSAATSTSYHSVFLWKDDGKVYLVGTDNVEFHDVDIYDVTNPRQPKPVGEYDMVELFPQIVEDPAPNGDNVFNHDMVVKEVNGRDVLLDSYWDAGYLLVDVENPAKPAYIGDVDFGTVDPLGLAANSPPEGNAHQAEFSHDNTYFLAADEDFNPYRADKFFIDGEERPAAEVGGGLSAASLPDQTLSGPVVYGGYGCPADPTVIPEADDYSDAELGLLPGDERILLMQRGPSGDPTADYNGNGDLTDDACFPGEKTDRAFDAGWDAVLLVNRHLGSAAADVPFCGSGGQSSDKLIVTLCATHGAFHELFGTPAEFSTYPEDTAIGDVSTGRIEATSVFDGWGYAHLYRNMGGKVEEVDAYAIPEAQDPDFAFGFGDLSIHEFAADPERNRAYISYYSGGVRVVEFGESGIEEVGHFIDADGNNFWGIETFVPSSSKAGNLQGKRLFAGSDRDHGIFIFRYTG